MPPVSPETLLAQLRWRYAVKKFDPARKIPAADWQALEETLILTPSSFGLQPWKFIVITDPAVKAQLPAMSWGQTQVVDASHVVVFAGRQEMSAEHIDRHLARMVEVRGGTVEALAGFRKLLMSSLVPPPEGFHIPHWSALQCYIALGNFMTSAAMLGIDTCPMEGIIPVQYDALLDLTKEGFRTVVVCVAGYRVPEEKYSSLPKVRFQSDDVIRRI